MKTYTKILDLLNNLPNGSLTKTLHAMDDYCGYLVADRLYELYDEDMLESIFKDKSPLDLITLGLHAGQNQEFYLSDKYIAISFDRDKIQTISENKSDEYYINRGYDWKDILDRLFEMFNYDNDAYFREDLPNEVVSILKSINKQLLKGFKKLTKL